MIHWLVTESPKLATTHAPSAINGWKLHAVEAPEDARLSMLSHTRSFCGLVPRYGWTLDLFIDGSEPSHFCVKCSAALSRSLR